MNVPNMVGLLAVGLLGAAAVSAEQQGNSPKPSDSDNLPKSIACAQDPGAPLDECSYLIDQNENGKTTVTVVFSNSFKRKLFFVDGAFQKANVTMSGVGTDTDWSLKDGLHIIRVDRQRYEVPAALILGN